MYLFLKYENKGSHSKLSLKRESYESIEDDETTTNNKNSSDLNNDEYDDVYESHEEENGFGDEEEPAENSKEAADSSKNCAESTTTDQATQITHRDMREILGDHIKETEVQTDIRMIHELQPPNKFQLMKQDSKLSMLNKTESKEVQTDPMAVPTNLSQV